MNVGVIGAGCVGSVIATRLSDSGAASVCLLARGARAERLKRKGLTVNGRRYTLPVLSGEGRRLDVVFVCVKNYQLAQACEDMRAAVSRDTVLLPLLNSISPVPELRSSYPCNEVLYGYISKIDTYSTDDGFAYNVPGDVHFGRAENGRQDETLDAIARMLSCAGFEASVDRDMRRSVWRKWMLNVGANQVSALTGADYLQFASIPEIEPLLRSAMGEVLTLARLEGVGLTQGDVDGLVEYLTTYRFPKKTSMLQDVEARRKTEIEYISGELLSLARKWGEPCPVNETLYSLIRAKEQAYLAEAGDGGK